MCCIDTPNLHSAPLGTKEDLWWRRQKSQLRGIWAVRCVEGMCGGSRSRRSYWIGRQLSRTCQSRISLRYVRRKQPFGIESQSLSDSFVSSLEGLSRDLSRCTFFWWWKWWAIATVRWALEERTISSGRFSVYPQLKWRDACVGTAPLFSSSLLLCPSRLPLVLLAFISLQCPVAALQDPYTLRWTSWRVTHGESSSCLSNTLQKPRQRFSLL